MILDCGLTFCWRHNFSIFIFRFQYDKHRLLNKKGSPFFVLLSFVWGFLVHILFDFFHALFTIGHHEVLHHIEVFGVVFQRFYELM